MEHFLRIAFSTICILAIQPAYAGNSLREKRIADVLEKHIVVGEVKWLEAKGEPFLTIFTETERNSKQGVIILHGMGGHPNWTQVIYPLRTQLTEFGWSTLSIQTPLLASSAGYADYLDIVTEISPRIEAAIQFYKSMGVEDIFVVGHSLGATMAMYYFSTLTKKTELRGLITISLSGQKRDNFEPLKLLEKVQSPMLDLYGGFDLPRVKNTLRARKLAATRGENTGYQQSEIPEADHFYRGTEAAMVKKIRGWMRSILKNMGRTP